MTLLAHQAIITSVSTTDPYWANVVALLHFDGSNGSTTMTDQRAHTFTSRNGAALSTAQQKFGPSSLLLNGSNQSIDSPTSTDWEMGSGDFTIEIFARPAASISSVQDLVIRWASYGFGLNTSAAGKIRGYVQSSGGGLSLVPDGATTITPSVWHHIVLTRDGGTLRTYLDGAQEGSVAVSGSIDAISSTLYVGTEAASIRYWNGNLDELRITKGVCRYPGGTTFTPPAAPFPNS